MHKFILPLLAFTSFVLISCAQRGPTDSHTRGDDDTGDTVAVDSAIHATASLSLTAASGNDYIAKAIPFAPVHALKAKLERKIASSLKDRGEAHITVITPPEFAALKSRLTRNDMLALAADLNIQAEPFRALCLGKGSKKEGGKDLTTYYLVVHDESLLTFRRSLHQQFVARGGRADAFDPERYYPHITLGYTKRDLHFEEGVIKDVSSCDPMLQA